MSRPLQRTPSTESVAPLPLRDGLADNQQLWDSFNRAWSAFLRNSHGLETNDADTVSKRTGVGEIIGYISPSEWMTNYANHPENIIRTVRADAHI